MRRRRKAKGGASASAAAAADGSDASQSAGEASGSSGASEEAERLPAAVYKPTRSFSAFLASVSTAFVAVLAFPLFFLLLLHGLRHVAELTPEELAAMEAAKADRWQNVPNMMPEVCLAPHTPAPPPPPPLLTLKCCAFFTTQGLEMGPDGKLVWESPEWKQRRVEMRDAGEKVRLFPEADDGNWVAVTEKRFLKSARRFLSREFSIELWTQLVDDMAKDEEASKRKG